VLEAPDRRIDGARTIAAPPLLQVEDLAFAYEGTAGSAVEGISLRAEPGGMVGIVGPVGSGKTTLLRLLARHYAPRAGSIRLAGILLEDLAESELRRAVAVVPQESFLFSMTLAENIALGRPEATREEVAEAGRKAGLDEDLRDLPDGYDTLVGERGHTLSGGQRQRAALARALLVRPAILLLDDPFSSVDSATEEAIVSELGALGHMTRIVAGHRVSAVQRADEILVLDAGRVVERGRHDALLAAGGLYARLYERQRTEQEIDRA